MQFTAIISALLASSVLAKALPNLFPQPTGAGFSLELVKRRFPETNANLEQRAAGAQASVGATNLSATQDKWMINVVVGGQNLPVVLDTGSSDLWFESTLEKPNMTTTGALLYTPTATTNSLPGSTWTAGFDGQSAGVAAGVAYTERLTIGSATLTNQIIGAATSVAAVNTDKKAGIIGLAAGGNQYNYYKFSNPSSYPPSVMGNLQQQLNISQFALDLRYDNGSRLDFGFIDSSRYTGSIAYANRLPGWVNWYITLDNIFYVNGTQQTGNMSGTGYTSIDSGAPYMRFPPAVVSAYYQSVTNASQIANGYWFPCSVVKQLPSFGISVNGTTFTVPSNWMWVYQSGSWCYGSLQASGAGYSYLGDMFLRTVFAVFDTKGGSGNGRVGFATKSLPTRPLPR